MDEKDNGAKREDDARKVVEKLWDEAKLVAQAQIEAAQLVGFSYGGQVLGGLISAAALSKAAFRAVDKKMFLHYADHVWDTIEGAHRMVTGGEAAKPEGERTQPKPLTLSEQAHVQQMLADALSKPEEGLGRA